MESGVSFREPLLDSPDESDDPTPLRSDDTREGRTEHGEYTYEEALSSVGYGKFHCVLLALCGWALSSDAIEVLAISFILPPATCDLHMSNSDKGLLNSSVFLGMMVGGYLWGTLADLYGRRYVLLWSLTVNGLGGLSSSFAPSYLSFVLLRFLSGFGVGGSLPVIFTYYTEFQPKEKRGSMISLLATFWMCGNIIAAGVAWIIIPLHVGVVSTHFTYTSWRIYLAVCTLPSISSALLFLLMPESPKFLMTEHRSQKAILVLRRIFRTNNPTKDVMTDFQVEHLLQDPSAQSERTHTGMDRASAADRCAQFKVACAKFIDSTRECFRPPLTSVSVTLTLIYFTLCFGYYGMFLWFPELFSRIEKYGGSPCSVGSGPAVLTNVTTNCTQDTSSKIYFESFLTAASNLPGNIFTIIMIDRVGRKIMLAGSMVVSGCSVFFIALLHNSTQSLVMSCVFSAISVMGWNALDVLQMELYPTRLRSTASGLLMSVGRMAAILGNLSFGELVDVYCLVPMFLVAGLLNAGGLLSLKLPNTAHVDID